jgi:hypothetical protein
MNIHIPSRKFNKGRRRPEQNKGRAPLFFFVEINDVPVAGHGEQTMTELE